MKYLTLLLSVYSLLILSGCQKDENENKPYSDENYIACVIDGDPIKIYENTSLNKADTTLTFQFSFSESFHPGLADTLINIQATLNRKSVSISFPWTDHPAKFEIYRTEPGSNEAKGFYQYVLKTCVDGNLTVFHTTDFNHADHFRTEKIGEIDITYVNLNEREFRGTFYFTAYGYLFPLTEGSIKSTNYRVEIKEGSFYYKAGK